MRNRILARGVVLQAIAPLAAALNLNNNFQLLPVPATVACALAYSTTIPNCGVADFQPANTCSDACVVGLLTIASGVSADCAGLQASDATLISKVLNGQIIPSVCPRNTVKPPPTPQKSSTPVPSVTAASSQTSTSQATSSVSSPASSPASSSPSASPSTSVTSTLSSASTAAATPSPQSASQQHTTSTTSTTSETSAPMLADQNGSRAGLSMKQQQLAAARDSRGGSPFDVVGYSQEGGTSKQQISGTLCAMVVVSWIWMLLSR